MPPLKPLRNKRRIGGNGIEWDTLDWKSVQSEDGQEVLDGFCGLEELDGNVLAALLANKSNSTTTKLKGEKGSILNSELNPPKEKKNKKQRKDKNINPDDTNVDGIKGDAIIGENKIEKEEEEQSEEVKKIKLQELKKKEMKKAQKMERRKRLKEKKTVKKEELKSTLIEKIIEEVVVEKGDALWGDIKLHVILQKSLLSLGFITPTPIQTAAIPKIITGKTDVVGAAETGSGKTLAFALPVIDSLLRNWESTRNQTCPYALIIAPTRELAMQITKVLKDVCAPFRNLRRIEVVSVVGGMAEQKQRRQLSGIAGNTVDILIATPGRLCELIQDESIVAFTDMSRMKFLIVDEADRIVEEGHFPELHRVFSRVRDHEKISERGESPEEAALKAKQGIYEMGDEDDNKKAMQETLRQRAEGINKIKMKDDKYRKNNKNTLFNEKEQVIELDENNSDNDEDGDNIEYFDDMDEEIVFDTMPTEAELEEARRTTEAIPYDELDHDSDDENNDENDKLKEIQNKIIENEKISKSLLVKQNEYIPRQRQTLLFSATAIAGQKDIFVGKKQKLKGLNGSEEVKSLPYHMQQLLSVVAVQNNPIIIDVTGHNLAKVKAIDKKEKKDTQKNKKNKDNDEEEEEEDDDNYDKTEELLATLPKGLEQFQVSVPTDDKDMMAYHCLIRYSGRTLLFVNSIKTARRVDGLLRALGLNCRTIHAQLQQRQRLRALESFRSSPIGVLVATDVAARGLDIPKITTVLHYDVARSSQVYIHRSGRTARANMTGRTISLVAPEDIIHHNAILKAQALVALPLFKPDNAALPLLRDRVKLAKKIFTQSFVLSQGTKENTWIKQNSTEADVDLDDYMVEEMGTQDKQQQIQLKAKKALDKLKFELKILLDKHQETAQSGIGSRKRGFVVFAK